MSSYGTRELIKWLECLGYRIQPQVGSRHLKYKCPIQVPVGIRPFIIVIQNRSTYDPITQREYRKDIRRHGHTKEHIEECMK